MPDIVKIRSLPSASDLTDDDFVPIDNARNGLRKIQLGGIISDLKSDLSQTQYELERTSKSADSTKTGVDLDIADPNGNVILRLKDGHIETKEFNSSEIANSINSKLDANQGSENAGKFLKVGDDGDVETDVVNVPTNIPSISSPDKETDLDIADINGNVILRLKNGGIKTKNFDSESLEDQNTYVTVKKDGTGDYTTLRGAIESITDADPLLKPYVIKIYPGTYNLTDEYSQAEISEADVSDYHSGFCGWMLTDGVSLVGIGGRKDIILSCVLDSNIYNARIRGNVSTINTQGTVSLENLTVIARNARYCVHDDFYYTKAGQYTRYVKNCDFIGKSLAHSPECTWGGGMSGGGENAVYENCDFGTDYGHHFDAAQSVHLVFRNCRGRKLRFAERNRAIYHYVTIEDSDFEMISLMRPSGVTEQHIMINSTGCEKAYVSCYDDDVIITSAITKTPVTGLPVGTMVARNTTYGNQYAAVSDKTIADGVIVANDDYFSYVQRTGYINTRILGFSGFSRGDYVTIDSNNALALGGTSANAVGQITFVSQDSDTTDNGIGFIKLMIGGKN